MPGLLRQRHGGEVRCRCGAHVVYSTGFFVTVSLDSVEIVSSHGGEQERRTAWI